MTRFEHECEVCGLTENLTPSEAFGTGWDYPPGMGVVGVLSARTCPNCPISKTLWWSLAIENKPSADLAADEIALIERIQGEPEFFKSIGIDTQRP